MQKGRNECVKILNKSLNTEESDTKKLTSEEFSHVLSKIIKTAGLYLNSFLNDLWRDSISVEKRIMFVWPGYYTYSPYGGERADTVGHENIIEIIDNEEPLTPSKIAKLKAIISNAVTHHGYGTYGEKDEKLTLFPLVIWFYLFYAKEINNNEIYGFTKWFEKIGTLYVGNGKDIVPLIAIEATTAKKNGLDKPQIHNGVLTIYVPEQKKNNPENLLKCFSDSLKEVEFYDYSNNEPLKIPVEQIPEYPPVAITQKENEEDIRQALRISFSLLFHSIFFGYNNDEEFPLNMSNLANDDTIDVIINRINKALYILKSFKQDNDFKNASFSHYYVFQINTGFKIKRSSIEINDFLGTMNLYSSHEIEPVYLNMIKKFLDSIYDQVRLIDVTREIEEESYNEAMVADYRMRAHEPMKFCNLIDKETPYQILNRIRLYFQTFFSIGPNEIENLEEIQSMLPDNYASGNNFREYVRNAIKISFYLFRSKSYIEDGKMDKTYDDQCDIIQHSDNIIDRIYNDSKLPKTSFNKQMKNENYYFFSALIVIFNNIYKHTTMIWDLNDIIIPKLEEKDGRKYIVITNYSLPADPNEEKIQRKLDKNKHKGTSLSVLTNIRKYTSNIPNNFRVIKLKSRVDGTKIWLFETRALLPDNFLEIK